MHAPVADRAPAVSDSTADASRAPANGNISAELSSEALATDVREAKAFLDDLRISCLQTPAGLTGRTQEDWATKLIRRHGVAGAVIEKAGSRAYVKRRPDDPAAFLGYVEKQLTAQASLLFRVGFGPLKNTNHCGALTDPDWAEYLTLVQLTRMMAGIAQIYPHGVKAEIVPDDLRTCGSNLCPASRAAQYIRALQGMVRRMGLESAITVESGQARLYKDYNVCAFHDDAVKTLNDWKESDPEGFGAKWASSVENAGKNIYCAREKTPEDVESAAWRYLVAHRAEILSGLWSPGDAFPLRYANHVNSYQIYTFGFKKTKLPWQIALPLDMVNAT